MFELIKGIKSNKRQVILFGLLGVMIVAAIIVFVVLPRISADTVPNSLVLSSTNSSLNNVAISNSKVVLTKTGGTTSSGSAAYQATGLISNPNNGWTAYNGSNLYTVVNNTNDSAGIQATSTDLLWLKYTPTTTLPSGITNISFGGTIKIGGGASTIYFNNNASPTGAKLFPVSESCSSAQTVYFTNESFSQANPLYVGIKRGSATTCQTQIDQITASAAYTTNTGGYYNDSGKLTMVNSYLTSANSVQWQNIVFSGTTNIPVGSAVDVQLCVSDDQTIFYSCAIKSYPAVAPYSFTNLNADFSSNQLRGKYARVALTLTPDAAKAATPSVPASATVYSSPFVVPTITPTVSSSPTPTAAPTITTVTQACETDNGIKLVIAGANFGVDTATKHVNFSANASAGGTYDNTATKISWADGSIVAKIPANLVTSLRTNYGGKIMVKLYDGPSTLLAQYPDTVSLSLMACGAVTNNPPTVQMTKPTANQEVAPGATIAIEALVDDPDPTPNGGIQKVEFYLNTTLLGARPPGTSALFTFPYQVPATMPAGAYQLKVVAYDNSAQHLTNTGTVTIIVKTTSTAQITSITPQVGATDTQITVKGSGFGTQAVTVFFVAGTEPVISVVPPQVSNWTDTQFQVTPPTLTKDKDYEIKIDLNGKTISSAPTVFRLRTTDTTCKNNNVDTRLVQLDTAKVAVGGSASFLLINAPSGATKADYIASLEDGRTSTQVTLDSFTQYMANWNGQTAWAGKITVSSNMPVGKYWLRLTHKSGCSLRIYPVEIIPGGSITACLATTQVASLLPLSVKGTAPITITGTGFGATKGTVVIKSNFSTATTNPINLSWSTDTSGITSVKFNLPDGMWPSNTYMIQLTTASGCVFNLGPISVVGKIWTGKASNDNWSDGANWADGTPPSLDANNPDDIFFLGTLGGKYPNANDASYIDMPVVAGRLDVTNYANTIKANANTVNVRKFVEKSSAGTFDATDASFHADDFYLFSGTFQAPKNTCSSDTNITNCLFLESKTNLNPTFQVDSVAKFIIGSGSEVVVVSNRDQKRTITVPYNFSFNNLAFIKYGLDTKASTTNVSAAQTIKVNNVLSVRNTANNYYEPNSSSVRNNLTINNINVDVKGVRFLGEMPVDFGKTASNIWVRGDFINQIGLTNLNFFSNIEFIDKTVESHLYQYASGSTVEPPIQQTYFQGNFKVAVPGKTVVFQSNAINFIKGDFVARGDETAKVIIKGSKSGTCPEPDKVCSCKSYNIDMPLDFCTQWAINAARDKMYITFADIADSYYVASDINSNSIVDEPTESPATATQSVEECNNSNWQILPV